jgi:hypothetical protein
MTAEQPEGSGGRAGSLALGGPGPRPPFQRNAGAALTQHGLTRPGRLRTFMRTTQARLLQLRHGQVTRYRLHGHHVAG